MKHKLVNFHKKIPWRTLQIGINLVSIVTGFSTFLPLSYVSKYFHWQCPLYAHIRLLGLNESTIYVDRQRTVWGSNTECMFTTFAPVTAGIHAFIWCWYYLLMKAQLKKEHQEFPMLVFSSVLHSILLVVTFVSSSVLSAGFNVWCYHLTQAVQNHDFRLSCSDTQTLMWPNVYDDNKKHSIYTFLRTAQVSSWLQTLTLLCQTVVSGYKLYLWILLATDGYLDIRKCGRSPSLQSDIADSLLEDDDNNAILYSAATENIGDLANVDIHVDGNEQTVKDVAK